jgi:hypothetical protein
LVSSSAGGCRIVDPTSYKGRYHSSGSFTPTLAVKYYDYRIRDRQVKLSLLLLDKMWNVTHNVLDIVRTSAYLAQNTLPPSTILQLPRFEGIFAHATIVAPHYTHATRETSLYHHHQKCTSRSSHNFMERENRLLLDFSRSEIVRPVWRTLRAWEHGGSNRASDSTFVRSFRLCLHHILSWFPAFPVVFFLTHTLYSGCPLLYFPNLLDWRRALDPGMVLVRLEREKRKKVLDSANGRMVVGFHKSVRTSLQVTGTFLGTLEQLHLKESWRWSVCSLVPRKEMAEDATWRLCGIFIKQIKPWWRIVVAANGWIGQARYVTDTAICLYLNESAMWSSSTDDDLKQGRNSRSIYIKPMIH